MKLMIVIVGIGGLDADLGGEIAVGRRFRGSLSGP